MALYAFTVPGPPVGKERPRLGKGRVYTPSRTKAYEQRVQAYALQAQVKPIKGPVKMEIHCYYPDARRRDIDNTSKAAMDALNGIAYADDSQVAELLTTKRIDRGDPRIEIRLAPQENDG
jgi:crossover junction endodeoxyribonuclease RusA